ncbi:hypothetical protein [Lysobacter gummosus]|uniref:hypothetical protein n=1 Tax=Lysobacter gummosus TaxID=262324 RepID=UPI00362A244C
MSRLRATASSGWLSAKTARLWFEPALFVREGEERLFVGRYTVRLARTRPRQPAVPTTRLPALPASSIRSGPRPLTAAPTPRSNRPRSGCAAPPASPGTHRRTRCA